MAEQGRGMTPGVCIAIVGAESTGKTALAGGLCERIGKATGLRCTWISELLRDWCDSHHRTPRVDEQLAIADGQAQRVRSAAAHFDVVIADTTPLMTAVYSEMLFADASLYDMALAHQQTYALTLLTALDLPWVPDGLQRDGPHVREPVDRAVRSALVRASVAWSVVSGTGAARLECALDAVTPLLLRAPAPQAGLFTRLREREAAQPAWQWVCDKCDVPECEHAALRR
jgi:nicotinamide riboside kinase